MSLAKKAWYTVGSAWARATKRRPVGRCIYTSDWDICIVLDSLRVDMLRDVLAGRGCDISVNTAWSRGSITTEWLTQTFRPPFESEIANTALVSASPHTQTVFRDRCWLTNSDSVTVGYPSNPAVRPSDFAEFHELWRSHADHRGAVRPEVMRDATIRAHESLPHRVVAHWLQPHEPFLVADAPVTGDGVTETDIWHGLQTGQLSRDRVWESYLANTQLVLDYVWDVLQAVDATVLLTSDHGNAFGELGVYGHPFGLLQPAVRKVPWVKLQANADRFIDTADVLNTQDTADCSRAAQLKALGYQ